MGGVRKIVLLPRWMTRTPPLLELLQERDRQRLDRMRQGLLNNLWGNNPGEIERWADDGGRDG